MITILTKALKISLKIMDFVCGIDVIYWWRYNSFSLSRNIARHVIKGSNNFMGGSHSRSVPILPSLVTIGTMVLET